MPTPRKTSINRSRAVKAAVNETKADREHRHRQELARLYINEAIPTIVASVVVLVVTLLCVGIIVGGGQNPTSQENAWKVLIGLIGVGGGLIFGRATPAKPGR